MASEFPPSPAGIIVIADIQDFSLMKAEDQLPAVERLWSYVERIDPLTSNREAERRDEVLWNGTGDGILVAFACNRIVPDKSEIIRFCDSLIEHCAAGQPPVKVRIGVHQGQFRRVRALGRVQVVGNGPNECARICSIGDGGHIVCSDDFVRPWHMDTEGVLKRFRPAELDHPLEVFVKHDMSMRVRFLRRQRSPRGPSRRIVRLDAADQRLLNTLEEIERVLVEVLRADESGPDGTTRSVREALDARISLLGYRKRDGRLYPTTFRFHAEDRFTAKGETSYLPGHGPFGAALKKRRVEVLHRLPDYEKDPEQYLSMLKQAGVPKATVRRRWSRHARSFVCFPVGIAENVVDAVVCIDMMDSLSRMERRKLAQIGEFLHDCFGPSLGAVWALRLAG